VGALLSSYPAHLPVGWPMMNCRLRRGLGQEMWAAKCSVKLALVEGGHICVCI